MTTTTKINGLSSAQPVNGASTDALTTSREKMISLVVEARLFQTQENGLQTKGLLPLPLREKDKAYAREVRTMLGELLGLKGQLPLHLRQLACSYFSDDDLGALSIYVNMPRHANLTDANVLKGYLDPSINQYVESCRIIVKEVYESTPRQISQNKYGSAFPINPEMLVYAMQLAKDETVLEIAGASGENSAALAFSGAKRVYLNDIGRQEIDTFEQIRKGLVKAIPSVGNKLESIHGDCFDLIKLKPELANKVGLVLCRNLIHFFNDAQQKKFFALLKKILKPGGHAIFTVNPVYAFAETYKAYEANPGAVSFELTMGTIFDYTRGTKPVGRFYLEVEACADDKVSTDFIARYLYTRKLGSNWQVDQEVYKQLGKTLGPKIKQAFDGYKSAVSEIAAGSVKILTNWTRSYSFKTLPALFDRHGFQVETTFLTAQNGHFIHHEDPVSLSTQQTKLSDRPQSIGVIVRFPGT